MTTVVFDSNVYRKVLCPSDFSKDPNLVEYEKLHSKIVNKEITAFLSEPIFGLEAIPRKERADFLNNFMPTKGVNESFCDEQIQLSYCIKPSDNTISLDKYHGKYLKVAIELNVKILHFNLIGLPLSNVPKEAHYELNNDTEKKDVNNKISELYKTIEDRGVGVSVLKALCQNYITDNLPWWYAIKRVPDKDKLAKAFSEWADGAAISCFYGYGFDFFCTNDQGKSAYSDSIFSESNKKWLKDAFGIRIVNLHELDCILECGR